MLIQEVEDILKNLKIVIIFSIITVFFLFGNSFSENVFAQTEENEILIASWNLLTFGEGRANNDENHQTMVEIMTGSNYSEVGYDYDIIFVQELRSHNVAFDNLCANYLNDLGYNCQRTLQLSGTGSNSESYGVIYLDYIDVTIIDTSDEMTPIHIPQGTNQSAGEMVRPPMLAHVTIGADEFEFFVYNNHIKPDDPDTRNELQVLQSAIESYHTGSSDDKIIVLGDLNADGGSVEHPDGTSCGPDYLGGGFENHPGLFDEPDWYQIFSHSNYTNFASNPCSYDKIIPNDQMYLHFTGESGIIGTLPDDTPFGRYPAPGFKAGDKHISDHKLIWAEFAYSLEIVEPATSPEPEPVPPAPGGPPTVPTPPDPNGPTGGGCLIATATYGSELSPQVQQLRELRDNYLLKTESGSNFMMEFNKLYYSFSPTIADLERESSIFKEVVKLTITPMILSLSILNYIDMDSEAEVLGYGISLILLNVGMYIVAPIGIGLVFIRKRV